MDNYDSILKEKKKSKPSLIQISETNSKKTNYVFWFIFATLVILVISYIVYFNTVLDGKNIFFNDIKIIKDKYYSVIKNLNFNYNLSNQYSFIGTINIKNGDDSNLLEYNIDNDGNKMLLNIHNEKTSLDYYSDKNNNFIKSPNIDDNYIMNSNATVYDYISLFGNIYGKIETFLEDKNNYTKSFYFENDTPVVKIEINLDKDKINELIGFNKFYLKDDYNIDITLLNNAINDELIRAKVIINNKSSNVRDVYDYTDGNILHTNNNDVNEKIKISNENDDFVLKYYIDDVLYSVLTGANNNGVYDYMYQVIDSKYNIKLTVNHSKDIYNYLFYINIDTDEKKYDINIELSGEYSNVGVVEEQTINSINIDTLDDEKMNSYNNIVSNLLGFDWIDVFTSNSKD